MFEEYYNIVTNVQNEIFGLGGVMIIYAQFIGAIGAIILAVKTMSKLQSGKNGYEALKKFSHVIIIALVLISYPFLMNTMNSFFDLMAKDLKNLANNRSHSYVIAMEKLELERRLQLRGLLEKMDPGIKTVDVSKDSKLLTEYINTHPELKNKKSSNKKTLGDIINDMNMIENSNSTSSFVDSSLDKLIMLFSRLTTGVLMLVRAFVLCVLYLLGPLAIGFFLIPGFEGSLVHWLQKYIHVSLWIVVAFVLELVLHSIHKVNIMSLSKGEIGSFYVTQGVGAVAIFGYFMIPSISTWLVQGVMTNFASKAMNIGKKAASVAAATATGGSSLAAEGGGQMIAEVGKKAASTASNIPSKSAESNESEEIR